jgi:hypothetical protein
MNTYMEFGSTYIEVRISNLCTYIEFEYVSTYIEFEYIKWSTYIQFQYV